MDATSWWFGFGAGFVVCFVATMALGSWARRRSEKGVQAIVHKVGPHSIPVVTTAYPLTVEETERAQASLRSWRREPFILPPGARLDILDVGEPTPEELQAVANLKDFDELCGRDAFINTLAAKEKRDDS